ncbi:MAG: MATE family efflux transporter, partial [Clostridiales bacterium]|nr:MATE family efflux transporter [Clostridiales bacterium]
MRIQLSDHFTYNKLYRFVLPTVIMMVFTSVYGIVDGLFVSNYAGRLPFAALNLIFPLIMILGSVGFMLGTGGNAVVSKTLGEGDKIKSNKIFSM